MISADVYKALVALAFIAGATITIEARYQKADAASQEHQYLAAESEVGRLETELRLIDIELKHLRGLQEFRELNQEENDRIEYLKQRKLLIEQRLLELTKSA